MCKNGVRETLPLFSQNFGSRTLCESSSGVRFLYSRKFFLKHHTNLSIASIFLSVYGAALAIGSRKSLLERKGEASYRALR
jgi:hypothetical protein